MERTITDSTATAVNVIKGVIAEKTSECSELAKEIETLKWMMQDKQADLDDKMKEMEKLYEFVRSAEGDAPKEEAPKENPAPPKKRGRKKKTEEIAEEREEMVTPTEIRSKEQVAQHLKYEKRKARKKAEAEAEAAKAPERTLEEVNAAAREAGLTYGKYMMREAIAEQSREMERARKLRHEEERRKNGNGEGLLGEDQET